MDPILRIQLLGVPRLMRGGIPAANIPTEKAKLLFFYLLLYRNVKHTRSMLAGLFWGDSPETQARRALNTVVWRLRKWLRSIHPQAESLLVLEDQEIGFNAGANCWIDIAAFEERIAWGQQMIHSTPEHAVAALQAAVNLYRGELLEGCYSDWCLLERDRLHRLFSQALLQLMVHHGARQEYPQAIIHAQRILADDPLREEIQRELIKLFLLNRQPAEALQQYRRCEAVLRQELGIDPMPETSALFREVVMQSATRPDPPALAPSITLNVTSSPNRALSEQIVSALERFETARAEMLQALDLLQQLTRGIQ